MNNKITLPTLATQLALRSGLSKKACEEFLRELFDLTGKTLSRGESVKIQDLGTFRISEVESRMSVDVTTGEPIEIPGHRKVVFVPDKELASSINEPFEAFEAREIPDAISEEIELDGETEAPELESLSIEPESTESAGRTEIIETTERTESIGSSGITDGTEEQENSENPERVEIAERYSTPLKGGPELEPRRKFGFTWGFVAGFLTCLAACGIAAVCWTAFSREQSAASTATALPTEEILAKALTEQLDSATTGDTLPETVPEETPAETEEALPAVPTTPSDTAAAAPAEPDKKTYDTVSTTRYLTTMAKEHYGNYNLWPYIYEENKAILGHPDRIRPGTRVVIPPLSKYGVNPASQADIEKAKKKGAAIYARYR